ncbi:MAG: DnaD domain protein [Eubacteriaceae bacterium]|jgi:DnaD/phage-associated family protein|nr:DnaD domain protein [Eubacteriaceae bacterium]
MGFTREKIKTTYLADTEVENLFIGEYMPDAPSDHVKVYLLALMCADLGKSISDEETAKTLHLGVPEVQKAWQYWENAGAVIRTGDVIEFVSLKEKLYGAKKDDKAKERAESSAAAPEENKSPLLPDGAELKELYTKIEMMTGKTISGSEMQEVLSWMTDFGATAETIAYAYRYCSEKGKMNVRYVGKVVMDWAGKNLDTKEQIEAHLGEEDQRHYTYQRIMKALGFNRFATEMEKQIIDKWLDELSCSMDDILYACGKTSGISNPNINYVNSVLNNMVKRPGKGPAGVSRSQVMAYYDEIRENEEKEAEDRRSEVYARVPRIRDIENEIIGLNSELMKIAISGGSGKSARLEGIRAKAADLSREKTMLMTENNIPVDYMDVRHICALCGDTGVKEDGSVCSCYAERAREAADR